MKLNGKTVYFVVRTLMIHSIALKKCALNATKLVIRLEIAERKMLFNAVSVTQSDILKKGVSKLGLPLQKRN